MFKGLKNKQAYFFVFYSLQKVFKKNQLPGCNDYKVFRSTFQYGTTKTVCFSRRGMFCCNFKSIAII
ncbi:hypothetical protein TH53_10795 [Pedobacter lusitanus]|uniref:Uncharacterized protein n=1 Tax=Pedobacter lusitanus TaxID=1503925 RepID=A0A0D0GLQ5_9SPHI|nr:hypothetical protein TH53_10795 [Pedobacter lusitanus]